MTDDRDRVAELLGRAPQGRFEVVVRDEGGDPIVIRNDPLLDDGTPMPTRYWLVHRGLRLAIDRIESGGGIRAAEAVIDPEEVADAHRRYGVERDAALPPGWSGPRPAGGVGGTRKGLKCLHAHYAWYLAGGDDPVGRWVELRLPSAGVAGLPGPAMNGPVAAIDCGTNSTRLLVAGPEGNTLARLMRITRLGQGVDQQRAMAPEAIGRTVEVLREYRRVMDDLGVKRIRMIATSVARDAVNRDEFFAAADAVIGVSPELLDGDAEGRLSFAGATAKLDPDDGPFLVVDIGGGSTEFSVGPAPDEPLEPTGVVSVDVGCVRITERFLHGDPPRPEELSQALSVVHDYLDDVQRELPGVPDAARFVGLAGTVTTVAAVEMGLPAYDPERIHHFLLHRAAVEDVFRTLATESRSQRAYNPGLEKERVDVIVGGCVVLVAIMRHFGFDECLVSEADILDGLALTLLDR